MVVNYILLMISSIHEVSSDFKKLVDEISHYWSLYNIMFFSYFHNSLLLFDKIYLAFALHAHHNFQHPLVSE